MNQQIEEGPSKLKSAAIINVGLSDEKGINNSASAIIEKYKTLLREKHGDNVPAEEEIYFIKNI